MAQAVNVQQDLIITKLQLIKIKMRQGDNARRVHLVHKGVGNAVSLQF